MSASFAIDYEWLPNEYGDDGEHSTLAALTINIGELCATEVEDTFAKTVRSSARLSAFHLAEWFAANWWRLLWEPETGDNTKTYSWSASHKIGNAGNGYVWPDLSFSSDWQSIQVRSRHTTRCKFEPIRYLNDFDYSIPVGDFERGVEDFINATIGRLSSLHNPHNELSALWGEVLEERRDPVMSERRRLEACMGYDPDEAHVDVLDGLIELTRMYGKGALQEVAAASGEQAIRQVSELYDDATQSALLVNVPQCDDIQKRLGTVQSAIPWRRAEIAAQIARETWGLTAPVSTKDFCDILNIQEQKFMDGDFASRQPLFAGFRGDSSPHEFSVSLNSRRETARRFALARLVADSIVAGEDEKLLPGTRARTDRQQFQRAFAQELLCPFESLRDYEFFSEGNPIDDDEIDEAAHYFTVSPLLVKSLLVNKGILERESLLDV